MNPSIQVTESCSKVDRELALIDEQDVFPRKLADSPGSAMV